MKKLSTLQNRMIKPRPSKRVYPAKKCKKPDCDIIFNPTNKRQEYCTTQHRIDHNNDLRALKEAPLKQLASKLTHNLEVLKKIHISLAFNNQNSFSIQLLQYELYNFGTYTDRSVNEGTGNEIEWVYNYGIEGKDINSKTFIIHNRKSKQQ